MDLSSFKDPELARGLIHSIEKWAPEHATLMEVCGTHTVAEFDAFQRFEPAVEPTQEPKGCRCGDVLRGMMAPNECPLFRKVCTPENPVGPCMVSSEGSCAAYFRYL